MAVDRCIISLQKLNKRQKDDGTPAGQDSCHAGKMFCHHKEIMAEVRAWQKRD